MQLYNSGGFNLPGTHYTEKDAEFIYDFYKYAIETKMVPRNTVMVLGEPAAPDAGGHSTIYHNLRYKTFCLVYEAVDYQIKRLQGKEQFGGIMVWDIGIDKDNNWGFFKTIFGEPEK